MKGMGARDRDSSEKSVALGEEVHKRARDLEKHRIRRLYAKTDKSASASLTLTTSRKAQARWLTRGCTGYTPKLLASFIVVNVAALGPEMLFAATTKPKGYCVPAGLLARHSGDRPRPRGPD